MSYSIKVITGDSKSLDPRSNRGGTTMISFKYNGKIWNPKNPEKKLKQLGITWDDVEVIENVKEEVKEEEYNNTKLYYFYNKKDGTSIASIYPTLEEYIKNANDYEQTSLETLEKLWSKNGSI